MEFRTAEAAAREVDQQVVLPGHCLQDIVKLPSLNRESLATIAGFGAVRMARYAARLEIELTPKWNT
jgi:ribonuclease D